MSAPDLMPDAVHTPPRRNACPSLAAPMPTGDGLLARLAPARAAFTPGELVTLAEAAAAHGNGVVEVSARGNMQIRGLTAHSAKQLAAMLAAAGLEIRTGVPVETSPLAGLDGAERRDPRPLAETLRRQLAEAGLAARLGPKVSVAIDGGGRFALSRLVADLRAVAMADGGWLILAGGAETDACPLGAADTDENAAAILMRLLACIARRGRLARGRDLDDGDAAAATACGLAPGVDRPAARDPVSPIGDFTLNTGKTALGFGLAFGASNARSLAVLARAADAVGADDIRLAPGKAVLVPHLDREQAERLRAAAHDAGFISNPADPRLSVVVCAGKPACASAHIDTRAIARRMAETFKNRLDGAPRLHISGCAKRCANPRCAVLEIVGTEDGCLVAPADAAGTALSRPTAVAAAAAEGLTGAVRALMDADAREDRGR